MCYIGRSFIDWPDCIVRIQVLCVEGKLRKLVLNIRFGHYIFSGLFKWVYNCVTHLCVRPHFLYSSYSWEYCEEHYVSDLP